MKNTGIENPLKFLNLANNIYISMSKFQVNKLKTHLKNIVTKRKKGLWLDKKGAQINIYLVTSKK